MRHSRLHRVIALIAVLALLLTCSVSAADFSYNENAPDYIPFAPPNWTDETVTFRSGGETISALMTLPAPDGSKVPMVVLVHGMNSDHTWCMDVGGALALAGIASLNIDLAGFGDSTGDTQDATLTSMKQNVLDALDYVNSLPFVDQNQVFLLGKSLGGVATLLAADEYTGKLAGICFWYPGFAVSKSVNDGYLFSSFFDSDDLPEYVNCYSLDMSFRPVCYTYGQGLLQECKDLDIGPYLEHLSIPVCIIHGDWDLVTPLQWSLMAEHLIPDCTLHVVRFGTHGFLGPPLRKALELTTDWFISQIS